MILEIQKLRMCKRLWRSGKRSSGRVQFWCVQDGQRYSPELGYVRVAAAIADKAQRNLNSLKARRLRRLRLIFLRILELWKLRRLLRLSPRSPRRRGSRFIVCWSRRDVRGIGGRIGEKLKVPGATLSFHLKELARAGLVSARQERQFIYYAVDFERMAELMTFLTQNCCQGMPREVSDRRRDGAGQLLRASDPKPKPKRRRS